MAALPRLKDSMLIDCRAIARDLDIATSSAIRASAARGIVPAVREIVATDNEAVHSYVRTKQKKADTLGVDYQAVAFERSATTGQILDAIGALNLEADIHGIMLGMPLFEHLDQDALANAIAANKDIDGLGAANTAYLATNRERLALAPATAIAAVHILETVTSLAGRRVVVLGRGPTVGRPVAAMLVNRDATVTICHSRSRDLDRLVAESEIVVSAIGRGHFVRPEWLRPSQIVVDCGISFIDGKTVGDVDAAAVTDPSVAITPVPGGVGVVTNAMLFANLLRAIGLQQA
jgi:methylenetetrahydrofolate dehydrogenase (NADP+)/methenyltetrahydrofolate cyclohydrolase